MSDVTSRRCRIVVTGGPGGGKTTAADLFRREMGTSVVVVPESATLLFQGGFPRYDEADARVAAQTAIFHVQRNLEEVQAARHAGRILLCDRGTVDGAAYWPGSHEAFFQHLGTTYEAELARYDGVIFFETAAAGGLPIEGNNPARTEDAQAALAIDRKLQALWRVHPRYTFVPNNHSFFKKSSFGLMALESLVGQLRNASVLPSSR
jgi:predicted ATPase